MVETSGGMLQPRTGQKGNSVTMDRLHVSAFRFAAIVAFGGFIFGLDAALISGTVRFITAEFGLSDLEVGAVVSAPGFGVIFALLATGYFCDRLGRKKTLLIIAALYLVSAVCSVLAPDFTSLVAARFLGGLAFTSLSVASMYIGEIAPDDMRGKLVSMNQLTIVFGLSTAYFANYLILLLSSQSGELIQALGIAEHTWRWMLGVEIVPAIAWLGLLFTVPESPRWLVLKEREADARAVLARIIPPGRIDASIRDIRSSIEQAPITGSFVSQVAELFDNRLRSAVLIGLTVAVVQPITGINAIMFYAPTVFEQVGIGTDASFFQAVVVGLVSILFTSLSLTLIDRLGRRPLICFGLGWAAASLFLCVWCFSDASYTLSPSVLSELGGEVEAGSLQALMGVRFESDVAFKAALTEALGPAMARSQEAALIQYAIEINTGLVLLGIMGFIAAFQFSIGPIMWVLFSEIFPIHVRGIAIPFFALVTSVVNYFVQQFFPWQLNNMGAAEIFLFYAVCICVGLGVLFRILPETKNRSIEDIEASLVRA